MVKQANIFRVFVSSTFRDFKQERDALQEQVFPRLQSYCAERRARFQAIDLRWGISQEASLSQRAVSICLNEIARCQKTTRRPNFMLLLGDRYGWQPLPESIPTSEFDDLESHIMDVATRNLLHKWYWRDDNAVPAVYVLQPRRAPYDVWQNWEPIEARLRKALQEAVKRTRFMPEQRVKYETSVTEQEVLAGIFNQPYGHEGGFCFVRSTEDLPDSPNAYFEDDPQAQGKLTHLKARLAQHLPAKNMTAFTARWRDGDLTDDHIVQFCEDVYNVLVRAIDAELAQAQEITPLKLEQAQQAAFLDARSQQFVRRVDALKAVDDYLRGLSKRPLVLHGPSGVGKTTVMTQAMRHTSDPIYRFTGATPASSDIRQMLLSLCEQIAERYGKRQVIPQDYDELVKAFPEFLGLANAQQPLVVFIDALDQLSSVNNPANLRWLPPELPDYVRLIVSVIPGDYLDNLRQRPDVEFFPIQRMSRDNAEALLDLWLTAAGRTLQSEQRNHLLRQFERNGLPLYLKLAFEEVRLWHSYSKKTKLADEVQSLLRDNLFTRLSRPEEHGTLLVEYSMAYLSASRNGLAEGEILDLLAANEDYWQAFQQSAFHETVRRQVPDVVWSRLALDMDAYLIERAIDGSSLLTFYHRQFAEVVDKLYLDARREAHHVQLAAYFTRQMLYSGESPNMRKLSEQAYQQAKGHRRDDYVATLTDFHFLQASVDIRDANALVADSDLMPDERSAQLVKSALNMSTHVLADSTQLGTQLYGRLMGQRDTHLEVKTLLQDIQADEEMPSLLPTTQTLQAAGGPLIRTLEGHRGGVNAIAFSNDGTHLVCAAGDGVVMVVNVELAHWGTSSLIRRPYRIGKHNRIERRFRLYRFR